MFEAEALGLELLASAKAIRVPKVITTGAYKSESFIILEFVESAPRKKIFWKDFGGSLAKLHKHAGEFFGLNHGNYIGSLPQSNKQHKDWPEFFIHERLENQVKLALDNRYLSKSHLSQFDSLYKRIPSIFPSEQPALLHGDLWSGNFIVDETGSACIIDPAVYFGNREMEIAFTTLFGGFDRKFYEAYNESYPLKEGFDQRKDLCNLYPLLVHLNLFGMSYLSQVEGILRQY